LESSGERNSKTIHYYHQEIYKIYNHSGLSPVSLKIKIQLVKF